MYYYTCGNYSIFGGPGVTHYVNTSFGESGIQNTFHRATEDIFTQNIHIPYTIFILKVDQVNLHT